MRPYTKKFVGLMLLGGVGWSIVTSTQVGWSAIAPKSPGIVDDMRSASGAGATPVIAAFAEQRTVPVFRTGLGSVQAFNSVTVTSRVDGQLDQLLFVEGQEVKAGEVLAVIDPRPYQAAVRQAEAQVRVSEAKIVAAKADLGRLEELQKSGVGSRQALDGKRADVGQLQATIEAAQAEAERARLDLEYTSITSPIDGRAGLRQVDTGNMIMAIDRKPIVIVTQLQPISVVFSLPQEDRVQVSEQLAKSRGLPVYAFARDSRTQLAEGTLTMVDNQIDPKTGTFKLKATFANTNNVLWPGQFVTVRLLLMQHPDAIVVPAPAVQRGPQGTYVYVIDADGKVAMRAVDVGQVQDGVATLEQGLSRGERIVVDGQYKLQPGDRVSISGAERPGGDGQPFYTVPERSGAPPS
jgi:multidrug efflux system membrane fusion protein